MKKVLQRKMTVLCAAALLAATLWGCGQAEQPDAAGAKSEATLPTTLFLDAAPQGDVLDVGQVVAAATDGQEVVMRGRVGGRVNPFVDGRAVVMLTDAKVKHCADIPGDNCPTPWDYCCIPREELAGNTASVAVVDESGKPVHATLAKAGGLEPMKIVLVKGVVHREAQGGGLMVHASGIHVLP